ncbi:MAG TPA: SHOCT domain-containing protein [Coriobacteriia bacterium]
MRIWMVVPMMLMWIVPLVLIAWMISAASSRQALSHGYGPAQPVAYVAALQIVRERYAHGEIDKATYERLVAELLGQA